MNDDSSQPTQKNARGVLTAVGKLCLPVISFLFGNLSPKWVTRWAKVFYIITWPFLRRTRKIVRANLAIALPEWNKKQSTILAKKNLQYIFELGLDWLHFLTNPADINRRLILTPEIDAFRHSRATDSSLPPTVFCTLHLGNWELASHVSYITGRKGAVVAARFDVEWFNELAAKARRAECFAL